MDNILKPILLDLADEPRIVEGRSGIWLLTVSMAALIALIVLFIYRKRKQKSS